MAELLARAFRAGAISQATADIRRIAAIEEALTEKGLVVDTDNMVIPIVPVMRKLKSEVLVKEYKQETVDLTGETGE